MRTIRNLFAVMAIASAVVACSSDDTPVIDPVAVATCTDGIKNGNETDVDCGGACKACPVDPGPTKDGKIESQDDVDLDVNDLKGEVSANITLAAASAWKLTGPLSVKDGFTLTIEAGTTISATAGGTDVYVAIEQGAKLMAVGTAAAPIKITSASGNPRSGDWGGLLIMGKAPISGGGTSTTEVVSYTYGGTVADDNSGDIQYMVLEYTGARINGEKEFNGFTFYGVGSGTNVQNIAALYGDDDGIEWFGGSVNVENALVINAKDDMFDWTQGYTGTGTNFYGLRAEGYNDVTEDPRGIEADGNLDGNSPADAGQSNPTIDGLVLIHNSVIEMADMIKIRRGSGATITNAYVELGAGSIAGDFVDFTDTKGDAIASTSVTVSASGIDILDVKPGANNGTITATEGTTPTVDSAIFAWTGFTF